MTQETLDGSHPATGVQELGLFTGGFLGSRIDVLEGLFIFTPGPDEFVIAVIDLFFAAGGSALSGQSYWNENSAPEVLPNTVTVGQDVIVTLLDTTIGLANPVADFVTTAASFAYDFNSANNPTYVSLSFPLTDDGWSGDAWLVIWP